MARVYHENIVVTIVDLKSKAFLLSVPTFIKLSSHCHKQSILFFTHLACTPFQKEC